MLQHDEISVSETEVMTEKDIRC